MKSSKWVWISLLTGLTAILIQCYFSLQQSMVEKSEVIVFVATRDVAEGQILKTSDYKKIKMVLKEGGSWKPNLSESDILLKTTQKRLKKGTLIEADDLSKTNSTMVREAIALKLSSENAYLGQLKEGEQVHVICYFQGEVKRYENLTVENLYREGENLESAWLFVSLSGEASALEQLVKCQNEGRIQIVKKISIHTVPSDL